MSNPSQKKSAEPPVYVQVTWIEYERGGYVLHAAKVPKETLKKFTLKSWPEDIRPIVIGRIAMMAEAECDALKDPG